MKTQYIVSTDLDGTLLNHHDYQWQDAEQALTSLASHHIPIIINTSKTRLEVANLIKALPVPEQSYVVENGSAIVLSTEHANQIDLKSQYENFQYIDGKPVWVLGENRASLCQWLYKLREKYDWNFQGYQDWSINQIIEKTGLSEADAAASSKKEFSEPFEWYDTQENLQKLTDSARLSGYKIVKGGRFYHLQGSVHKASLFDFIHEFKNQLYPEFESIRFIALGDNHNDIDMLNQADYSIVIKSPTDTKLELSKNKQVIYSQSFGAKGWNEEILTLLTFIKLPTINEK